MPNRFPFNTPNHPEDNRSINKAFDRNYGNRLKSGDTTTLKYTIKDGDGEPLDKERLPNMQTSLILKYEGVTAYKTEFEATLEEVTENYVGDLVARFRIDEALPPSDTPYVVEFHFEDDEDLFIFPSVNTLELYITPSALNSDEEAIDKAADERLNEIVERKLEENPVLLEVEANELARQENYQELLDTGVMQTKINERLEDLEEEYAPKLTEVTAQLAQKAMELDVLKNNKADKTEIDDFQNRVDEIIATPTTVSEQEIIDARHGATSLGSNINHVKSTLYEHIDNYNLNGQYAGENILSNNNFESTSGWTEYRVGSTVSVVNNTLSITGDGTAIAPRTLADTSDILQGDIHYIKAELKVNSNECESIAIFAIGSSTGITRYASSIDSPEMGLWHRISGLYDRNDAGELRVGFIQNYDSSGTANGKELQVRKPIVLNLTRIFGAGNEPTAEEVDEMLSKYPESWFGGVGGLIGFKDGFRTLEEKIKNIDIPDIIPSRHKGYIDNPVQSEWTGQAMVTFSYDDGYLNNYELALPIHEKWGIPATFNIISNAINGNDAGTRFMTPQQVMNTYNRGIEIGSHSKSHGSHFTTLSDEELHIEFLESKAELEEIIGAGNVHTIAIPFSQHDERVRNIGAEYYKGIRVFDESYNTMPPQNRYRIYSRYAVTNNTTFENIKTYIDNAISNNRWVVIMMHGINNHSNKSQYETSQRVLDKILEYVATLGRETILPINTKDALQFTLGVDY